MAVVDRLAVVKVAQDEEEDGRMVMMSEGVQVDHKVIHCKHYHLDVQEEE